MPKNSKSGLWDYKTPFVGQIGGKLSFKPFFQILFLSTIKINFTPISLLVPLGKTLAFIAFSETSKQKPPYAS